MPKRSSKIQKSEDVAEVQSTALEEQVIGDVLKNHKVKNPAAVALGRLGGAVGGRARALKLSAEERSEIAKRAASARWAKIETTGEG